MRYSNIIRKINAAALLLLFLFGATPKRFLHDAIANHKDKPTVDKCASQNTVAKLPVYCHCDDLVIESPFIGDASDTQIRVVSVYSIIQYQFAENYYSLPNSCSHLRGPPLIYFL